MVELLSLYTLSRGMKDVFRLPRGLGLRGVIQLYETLQSRVVDVFIILRFSDPVNPFVPPDTLTLSGNSKISK